MSNPDTTMRVLAAMTTDPQTAKTIATTTGLGYSTVTAIIRDLVSIGSVVATKDGRSNVYAAQPSSAVRESADAHTAAQANDDDPGDPYGLPDMPGTEPGAADVMDDVHQDATDDAADAGYAHTAKPSEMAADATPWPSVPEPPAGSSMADVEAFMAGVRPVPAAPVETPAEPKARKTRTPREPREPRADRPPRRNDFKGGSLQDLILETMQAGDAGHDWSAAELANTHNAHASSVTYSLKRLVAKGNAVRSETDGQKPRWRVV